MGHTLKIGLGLISAVLCFGQVTVRTICSSGCQYTPGQIQTAVNNANPGDIITIDPASGASTVTGLELPAKTNPNHLYVTIRSANIYNFPANTRVSPADPNLATITYTFPSYLTMYADPMASFYRFEGIKFTILQGNPITNMIQFGQVVEGRTFDNQVSRLAHDFEFDRCVFAGYPGKPGPYRAIAANMGRMSITNSYFYEIKGVNGESQDIAGWNTFGPFYFKNNHFEASTEETIFGGAQPNITGVRATDLTYIGNEYYKPWTWRFRTGTGAPSGACMYDSRGGEWYVDKNTGGLIYNCNSSNAWAITTEASMAGAIYEDPLNYTSATVDPSGSCTSGKYYKNTTTPSYWECVSSAWVSIAIGPFSAVAFDGYWEKNHFELKNAQRAFVEGNYIHQSWLPTAGSQHGACFLFNQVDNINGKVPPFGEPSAGIFWVTVQYNHCDSTPWGISDGVLGTSNYFYPIHDVNVHDNLFTNMGGEPFSLADVQLIQTGNTGKYSFNYNTSVSPQLVNGWISDMNNPIYTGPYGQQIEFVGNIASFLKVGFYAETGAGSLWNAFDTTWAMNRSLTKDVIVNTQGIAGQPTSNIFHASDKPTYSGQVPCPSCAAPRYYENGGVTDVGFVNYAGGDYHLKSTSPYAGWWAHGRPAGADIDQVNWSTAQALTGIPNPFTDFKVRSLVHARASASIGYTAYSATACITTASTRPDLANVTFTGTDSGGDRDRTISITGLAPGTRYFYSLACDGYTRSGQFLTNP